MTDLKKKIEDILHPEFKKMQKIAVERLHPPPEPMASEKDSLEQNNPMSSRSGVKILNDSKPTIDFNAIAQSSEFQRFIYFLFTGKVHRGTLTQLNREINKFKEDSNLVRNYQEVLKELKEKIKNRRVE